MTDSKESILAAEASRYEAIRREILALGWVRPGSLIRRFMPCGRTGCRCMASPPKLHGPYYQWSHKVRGKTVTRRLDADQAARCKEWIAQHRQLRTLVRKLEALALRVTDRILGEISRP